jgi:hypothetical protein
MSSPGHHNEVVVVGEVREVSPDGRGAVSGVSLLVDAGAACDVPVVSPAARPGVSVGERLWVRGRLACAPRPQRPASLRVVQARRLETGTRPRPPSWQRRHASGDRSGPRHQP